MNTTRVKSIFRNLAFILLASGIFSVQCKAQILIQDTFDRGTPGSLLEIRDTLPDINTGVAWKESSGSGAGVGNITTGTFFQTNGSALKFTTTNDQTAYLPFTLTEGDTYTLSADVTLGSDITSTGWFGFGFGTGLSRYGNGADPANSTSPWMLFRPNGQYTVFQKATISILTGSVTATANTTYSLSVVLNTSGSNWTATYLINGSQVGTYSYASDPTITTIFIGQNGALSGVSIDNLMLTQIPEPSTVSLIALGHISLILVHCIRRRLHLS